MSLLALIYHYRHLVAACEAGSGLSLDEIEMVSAIEGKFAVLPDLGDKKYRDRPVLGTEPVTIAAVLRRRGISDAVRLTNVGPEGLVCVGAPFVREGDHVELIIEDVNDEKCYRFGGEVIWGEDLGGHYELEVRFTGVPVLVRYGTHATRPATGNDGLPSKPAALIVSEPALVA